MGDNKSSQEILLIVNSTNNYVRIVFSSSESKYYMKNYSRKTYIVDRETIVSIFTILNSKVCLIDKQKISTPCTIEITDNHIVRARKKNF